MHANYDCQGVFRARVLPSVENGVCRGASAIPASRRTTVGPTSLPHLNPSGNAAGRQYQPQLIDVPLNQYGSGQNFREPRVMGETIPLFDQRCFTQKEVVSRCGTCGPKPSPRRGVEVCAPESDRDYPLAGPCIRKPICKSHVPRPNVSGC